MPKEEYEEYIEHKIFQPTDKIELTKEQYEQLVEDLEIAQMQLQEANDTLNGGITARNMASFRNTYVINASDSLDATHPMYVYFHVLEETVKIVSIKVSYWIQKYRAYSKAAAADGAQTSTADGAQTSTSEGTPSGGGSTSGVESAATGYDLPAAYVYGAYNGVDGYLPVSKAIVNIPNQNHTHSTPNHTHPNHSHDISNHTHDISNHTHAAQYGIFEEDTTPIISFSVSQDGGVGYGKGYGKVAINQELINITDSITTVGSKVIKFESTTRARLTVQVEIKLDIKVR